VICREQRVGLDFAVRPLSSSNPHASLVPQANSVA